MWSLGIRKTVLIITKWIATNRYRTKAAPEERVN